MNFLHYFKSSVTLKCWIKGTACKGWIMPTMTSSTGITLSACSALSRKQTFFYCSILFPFYFLHHRHYFPFRPMTLSKGKCSKTKKSSRDHKASSSYISQLVFFWGGEWGSEFIFCFQLPPFLFLFQTVARSTLPNRRHSFTPVGWGIMAGKEKKKKKQESSRWRHTHWKRCTQPHDANKLFFFFCLYFFLPNKKRKNFSLKK